MKQKILLLVMCMSMTFLSVCAYADVTLDAQNYSSNIPETAFVDNEIYRLTGQFDNDLAIRVPIGKNITLDGSGATFKGTVRITINGIAGNANDLTAAPRSGKYTIQNFAMEEGMGIGSCKIESITVKNNQLGALSLNCSNSKVIVTGNTINSTKTSYDRYDAATHKGGIHVYSDNYDISVIDNEITSQDAAFTVVGEYGWHGYAEFENKWSIEKNTLIGKNRIFKIWNDKTYAPVEWPQEYKVTEEMLKLTEQLFAKNTLPQPCDKSVVDVLMRKEGGPDLNATENNFEPFIEIMKKYVKEPANIVNGNNLPQTGDSSSMILWLTALLASMAAMLGVAHFKKQNA